MIIYGTKAFNSKKGTANEMILCNQCGYETYWELLNSRSWFTLFFIPIFPYKTEELLICPRCECGVKITDENRNEIMEIMKPEMEDIAQENKQESKVEMRMENVSENLYQDTGLKIGDSFELTNVESLLQIEKKSLMKYSGIGGGVAVIMLFLVFLDGGTRFFFQAFAVLFALYMAIFIPTQMITYLRNSKRTLASIRVVSDGILFEEEEIAFHNIKNAQITHLNVRTSSPIIAAQRYLTVNTDNGKMKFWLGSHVSVQDGDYLRLCDFLGEVFAEHNVKYTISTKRPVLV